LHCALIFVFTDNFFPNRHLFDNNPHQVDPLSFPLFHLCQPAKKSSSSSLPLPAS
jgi:hypothetical protein